jgi:hypothetical protein
MEAFQIARTPQTINITIKTEGVDADVLMEMLRRIQVEYLARKVDFDDSILDLAKEINRDWWAKNKSRLLGAEHEEGRS